MRWVCVFWVTLLSAFNETSVCILSNSTQCFQWDECVYFAGVIHTHHSHKLDTTDEEAMGNLMRLDDVCKPGNTLLWDLLQDDTAVSASYSI